MSIWITAEIVHSVSAFSCSPGDQLSHGVHLTPLLLQFAGAGMVLATSTICALDRGRSGSLPHILAASRSARHN